MSETRELQFTLEEKETSGMQIDIHKWDGSKLCRLSVYDWGSENSIGPYGAIDIRVVPEQQIEVQAWKEGEPIIAVKLQPEINSVSVAIHGVEEAKQDEKLRDDTGDTSSSDTVSDSSL